MQVFNESLWLKKICKFIAKIRGKSQKLTLTRSNLADDVKALYCIVRWCGFVWAVNDLVFIIMCASSMDLALSPRDRRGSNESTNRLRYGFYLLIYNTGNLIFANFIIIGAFIRCIGISVPEYCFWSSVRYRMESRSAEADKSDLRPGKRDTL